MSVYIGPSSAESVSRCGLHTCNVAEAIQQVRPFAADVCNGVRTEGKWDEAKWSAFVSQGEETETVLCLHKAI
jgi:phosphoribosylanthranilate isomerase